MVAWGRYTPSYVICAQSMVPVRLGDGAVRVEDGAAIVIHILRVCATCGARNRSFGPAPHGLEIVLEINFTFMGLAHPPWSCW